MWQGKERRQFYRVEDRVALRFTRLHDDQSVSSELARLSLHNRIMALNQELEHELSVLAEQSPRIHHIAQLLNEKLTLGMSALTMKGYPDESALKQTAINLSASGLAFDVDEWVKTGERLLVDVVFYPEGEHFSAIVRVIDSDTTGDGYRLRTDFERLPEHDRERLVRHILTVQSRRIRELRGVSGQGGPSEA
ncbi:PilZ domain-containing protein [Marinobacter caseinilyticus]|uniref:PilZ domain-containing protein n=1 Tax=Marinobacter caseinilyticus TaxID=2692195 RepID=UPI001407B246|nr:PilZ domain-containing protein [Marinobacter caseinilyticus]